MRTDFLFKRLFAGLFLFILTLLHVTAFAKLEDDKPIGWASQSGGTTGGQGGSVHNCSSVGEANKYLGGSGKAIVFLSGGGGSIKMGSNKTLIGVGGPRLGGIYIGGQSNIIIRNITIRQGKCGSYNACKSGGDGIAISGSKHIWIDHCDIADGKDESISITHDCNYISLTWNKFHYTYDKDHAFFNLVASSNGDEGGYNITYAYNWWVENILQRMPRSRFGEIHVVNNLYTSVGNDYCIGVGKSTTSRIENNVFLNVNMPVMIAASSAGGIILGNLYDTSERDPNGRGADFTPFQDFVEGNVFDSAWGNGGFEPPYKMDVYPTGVVEEMVKKWAGTKLEEFDKDFKAPTGTPTSAMPRTNTIYPMFTGRQIISMDYLKGSPINVFTLRGKRAFSGRLNVKQFFLPLDNVYYIQPGSSAD